MATKVHPLCCICREHKKAGMVCRQCNEGIQCPDCFDKNDSNRCPICRLEFPKPVEVKVRIVDQPSHLINRTRLHRQQTQHRNKKKIIICCTNLFVLIACLIMISVLGSLILSGLKHNYEMAEAIFWGVVITMIVCLCICVTTFKTVYN